MKTLRNILQRRFFLAALPAALAFASCGDDNDSAAPAPDQGRVIFAHEAASSTGSVKFVANDNKEVASQAFGTSSSYAAVNAGSQTIKINDATSGSTVGTQTVTIDKDKNYSVFAYSPSATLGSLASLAVNDDLTAPNTGKAKIRLVHLGVGSPNAVSLSLPNATVGTSDIITNVAFGTASTFTEITPGPYNLAVSIGSGATATIEASVGDGTGSNTATTKTYAAGKIYTVVLRGVKSNSIPDAQRLKAVIIEHN
ncbi:DUF4397 domain-containing protein [Hymenobacter chitinivorans]|uniref:Uncharacterized protein DUF4397 n=1 Tax=Hymenobacter chitinivorans DSM 11115 TaxID=1121954 RepID=A0A2M9B9K4_9BACT|nr:DUF4397 domain-containing protein [Hymenobacter chitinivorans]PJJ54629.1 uncharacterized protein DUF4397 [Hymenobacter chitinivorans DSM 11115]